jgi:hypothetical protein
MKRRPGRPHVSPDDTSVQVGLTLPAKEYDRLCRKALRLEMSVAAVIRRELDRIKIQKPE